MSNKEPKEVINLSGQICPFPVMRIVRDADMLPKGESATFLVDDPWQSRLSLKNLKTSMISLLRLKLSVINGK